METSEDKSILALAIVGNLPKVNNVWYDEKTFCIDGFHFVGCRFDKCTIEVNTSNFKLERCFISTDTRIVFGWGLVNAICMFNRNASWLDAKLPDFVPERHADGKISIGV